MKSIKDIKKEIGYVEFSKLKTDITIIPIYSLRINKNSIRVETKQHEKIKQIFKMSNFYDEKNILLSGEKIEFSIILFKNRKKIIEFGSKKKGFITDLVISKNIYHFTLTE